MVALGLPFAGRPIVRIIHIRSMVEEHTYRRFRFSFLRIHRQAVMGNERRYFYDYYMLVCGPIALFDRVADPDASVEAFRRRWRTDHGRPCKPFRSRARDTDNCENHLACLS